MTFSYDDNMIVNDVLRYLINNRYAICDMTYDEPNDTYTINVVRPDDYVEPISTPYETYVATVTTHMNDSNPDDPIYSHELIITPS